MFFPLLKKLFGLIVISFSKYIITISAKDFSSKTLNEEIKYFFSDFLKDREFQSNDWWYGWKDTTFQEAYTDFSFFLKEVLDKLETQNN